ncbi:hypothetical protein H0H92_011992, partial [Tricholoma furcatifolium]
MGNTSSKSKPSSASKVKRRLTAAPKSYYDYEMPMPHGYYPSAAEYYGHPQAIPPYANPPAPQYPYFYPGPHAMPEPQPFIPPPPVRRVPPPQISDPPAPQPLAPATQPYAQNTTRSAAVQPVTQPVIPPAPQRERTRQKRTTTRKKPKPKPIIVYDPPVNVHKLEPTQDADIPRSLPGASTPQRGNSTPQPPASSPSHARRSTTNTAHSTPQTHHTSSPATTSRSYERPPNPLPPPPVDIFATTPYRHLLELKPEPEIPGITYFAPGQQFIVRQEGPPKEKEKKGLFGMMKKSPPQTIRETKFVFLGQPASPTSAAPPPASATSSVNPPPTTATTAPTPATHDTGFQQPSPPPGSSAQSYFQGQSQSHGSDSGHSHPPAAPAATAIFFNQDTEYSAFLNHAPYSVSYERVRYPTATHLLEALKFLPGDQERQNIAELIRTREDTADVYRIAHEYRECQNEDYRESYMQKMEMVMFLKFSQHGELKDLLLETGEAPLVYDDPSDSFWGIGQQADGQPGQNELGVILERIRRRFGLKAQERDDHEGEHFQEASLLGRGSLPSELKADIASYCSPAALTSLALQRQFQVEAERALYATIVVTSDSASSRQLGVLETLAASREKATYVRFLQVALKRHSPEHDIAAKALMSVLPTLVSLKDLRMRFDDNEQPFSRDLTVILT